MGGRAEARWVRLELLPSLTHYLPLRCSTESCAASVLGLVVITANKNVNQSVIKINLKRLLLEASLLLIHIFYWSDHLCPSVSDHLHHFTDKENRGSES